MKTITRLLPLLIVLAACQKPSEDQQALNPPGATDLSTLTIPESFSWSSSVKGLTELSFPEKFNAEGKEIWIIDEQGNRLDRKLVSGNKAHFKILLPQNEGQYYFYFPATEESQMITQTGNVVFDPGKGKKSAVKAKATSANLLVNGDFQSSTFSQTANTPLSGASATTYTGGWWVKTSDASNIILSPSLRQAVSGSSATVLQTIPANPSSAYKFSIGSSGAGVNVNLISIDNNGTILSNNGDFFAYPAPLGQGGPTEKSFTTPANTAFILVTIGVGNGTWVDWVKLETGGTDVDGDGVANSVDDYPNDPNLAYKNTYPTAGYQTLAFEDLWPNKGDYDFNDMVVSSTMEVASNAANEKVQVTFNMTVDAAGSGFHHGLGVQIMYADDFPINYDVIESVSGDAIQDPDNQNGVIVFDDVFVEQGSGYYTNNGTGPDGTPMSFTFTISFTQYFIDQDKRWGIDIGPDIYIFRTSDRAHEIHQFNFYGTSVSNMSQLYNTGDDAGTNGPFKTQNGLPWVFEVVTLNKTFRHPVEKTDILEAYPNFQSWAESNGQQNADWMDTPVSGKVY